MGQCRHSGRVDSVLEPDCGDGVVRFILYGFSRPLASLVLEDDGLVSSSSEGLLSKVSACLDVGLLGRLFSRG